MGMLAAYALARLRWARWISAAFFGWTLIFHTLPT